MGIPRHGEAQPVDDFVLPDLWCFHIYSYHAVLELNGAPQIIQPGHASIVPPGVRTVYRYQGPSDHVYFHFEPVDDKPKVELPMVIGLGERFKSMDDRARKAVSYFPPNRAYPRSALWSLLCEYSEIAMPDQMPSLTSSHPLVDMAVKHIEQRLAGEITVSRLCEEVGVSYGYLGRLFKSWLGCSVLEHIRNRRADHAEHLITSTTMPIKVIARAVGVPNLQQFNRMMRLMKGESPRSLRKRERSLGSKIGK